MRLRYALGLMSLASYTTHALLTPSIDSFLDTSNLLDISLQSTGKDSVIQAIIVNKDTVNGYNLFTPNTILDPAPVDRVTVLVDGTIPVESLGLRRAFTSTQDFGIESFVSLHPGQTLEVELDIAQSHRLHEASLDKFHVFANGSFQFAELNSTQVVPDARLPFSTNTIAIQVDKKHAASVFNSFHSNLRKRADVTPSCDADENQKLTDALAGCTDRAGAAALLAEQGTDARFKRYFFDHHKEEVADRLAAYSGECGNYRSAKAVIYCKNPFGAVAHCVAGQAAFVIGSSEVMVICPFFWQLPLVNRDCTDTTRSQIGVMIHEMTHIEKLFTPYCHDYEYKKKRCTQLPPRKALTNAASYAFFAMDNYVKC